MLKRGPTYPSTTHSRGGSQDTLDNLDLLISLDFYNSVEPRHLGYHFLFFFLFIISYVSFLLFFKSVVPDGHFSPNCMVAARGTPSTHLMASIPHVRYGAECTHVSECARYFFSHWYNTRKLLLTSKENAWTWQPFGACELKIFKSCLCETENELFESLKFRP